LRSLNLARSPDVPSTTFPQGLGEVEADILTGSQPDGSAFSLMPLPVTDAVGFAYLHRHAAARAGVAVAGNYNWLSSFHVPL